VFLMSNEESVYANIVMLLVVAYIKSAECIID